MVEVKVKDFGSGIKKVAQKAETNKARKELKGVVGPAMRALGIVPETQHAK